MDSDLERDLYDQDQIKKEEEACRMFETKRSTPATSAMITPSRTTLSTDDLKKIQTKLQSVLDTRFDRIKAGTTIRLLKWKGISLSRPAFFVNMAKSNCIGHKKSHGIPVSYWDFKFSGTSTSVHDGKMPDFILSQTCKGADYKDHGEFFPQRASMASFQLTALTHPWLLECFPEAIERDVSGDDIFVTDDIKSEAKFDTVMPHENLALQPPPTSHAFTLPPVVTPKKKKDGKKEVKEEDDGDDTPLRLLKRPVEKKTKEDKKAKNRQYDAKRREKNAKKNAQTKFDKIIRNSASLPEFDTWSEDQKTFWARAFCTFSTSQAFRLWTRSDAAVDMYKKFKGCTLTPVEYRLRARGKNLMDDNFTTLLTTVRERLPSVVSIPMCTATYLFECWTKFVPVEQKDHFMLQSKTGSGYVYNPGTGLWEQQEREAMKILWHTTLAESIKAEMNVEDTKIAFKTNKKRIDFLKQLDSGFQLDGAYMRWVISHPDTSIIPITDKKNTWGIALQDGVFFNCKDGKIQPRKKGNYFRYFTAFKYLQDHVRSDGYKINDTKLRTSLVQYLNRCQTAGKPFDYTEVMNAIRKLFPSGVKFMSHLFQDDKRIFTYLLFHGASLTGGGFCKSMFVEGPARCGKSSHTAAHKGIFGKYMTFLDHTSFTEDKNTSSNGHQANLVPIKDCRVVCIDEWGGKKVNQTLFKKIVAHNPVAIRDAHAKGTDSVELDVMLIGYCNPEDRPQWGVTTSAIRRRIVTLRSNTKTFDERSEKPEGYNPSTWVDKEIGGIFWVRSQTDNFAHSFTGTDEGTNIEATDDPFGVETTTDSQYDDNADELGSLICFMAHLAYGLSRGGKVDLPIPAEVQEDTDNFIRANDVITDFREIHFKSISQTDGGVVLPKSEVIAKVKESNIDIGTYYREFKRFCLDERHMEHPPSLKSVIDSLSDLGLIYQNGHQKLCLLTRAGVTVVPPDPMDTQHDPVAPEKKVQIPDSPRSPRTPSPDPFATPPRSSEKRKKKDSSTRSSSKHSCIRPPTP